jgi:long-chain fatty acid transport protein
MKKLLFVFCGLIISNQAFASGFGVFTQGASALGQANAVVAHTTGPSSLYFNPALINDLSGSQIEIGTTGISASRSVDYSGVGTSQADDSWNFPSTFYYTHQVNDSLTTGIGAFFPFGLSTEWPDDYEGRYLGTAGDITTTDINPALSYRLNNRLSLAFGLNALYLDATLEKKINQTAAYTITDLQLSGGVGGVLPALAAPLADIGQNFTGDGWGYGYNLGILYKANDQFNLGVSYRSHIDVDIDGRAAFSGVTPLLSSAFSDTDGHSEIRLPEQMTAAVAYEGFPDFILETGVRWENWESTDSLVVNLDQPVFGQSSDVIPRNWQATWSYNLGAHYNLNDKISLNTGYLYGQNAVPGDTFEPLVPDSDAHLITFGMDYKTDAWSISGAFGYEYHQDRIKSNSLGDPLGSLIAAQPVSTANGNYENEIFLAALSLGFHF